MAQQGDGGAASANAAEQAKKDSLYEDRPRTKKIIRVITVMAYLSSVSFVAVVLSGYYVFLWQPPNPRLLHRAHLRADPQVQYRVDDEGGPSTLDIEGRPKLFGGNVLRNHSTDISGLPDRRIEESDGGRPESPEEPFSRNGKLSDSSRTASTTWNPIVRAFIASKTDAASRGTRTTEKTRQSVVYEGVDKVPMNESGHGASELFTERREINEPIPTDRTASTPASGQRKTNEETSGVLGSGENDQGTFDVGPGSNVTELSQEITTTGDYESVENGGRAGRQKNLGTSTSKNQGDSTESYPGSGPWSGHEASEVGGENLGNKTGAHLEFIAEPNKLGSQIARISMNPIVGNDSADSQKPETNLPIEHPSPDIRTDESTEHVEPLRETLELESSPSIVQPEPEVLDEGKRSTKERLTQDTSDFDFI